MDEVKISLASARVNAKMTQKQVAEKLKISKLTLVNWEKGRTKIPFAFLVSLCSIYNIPVDFICVPSNLTSGEG